MLLTSWMSGTVLVFKELAAYSGRQANKEVRMTVWHNVMKYAKWALIARAEEALIQKREVRKGIREEGAFEWRVKSGHCWSQPNNWVGEGRSDQTRWAHIQRPRDQKKCSVLDDLSIAHHEGAWWLWWGRSGEVGESADETALCRHMVLRDRGFFLRSHLTCGKTTLAAKWAMTCHGTWWKAKGLMKVSTQVVARKEGRR